MSINTTRRYYLLKRLRARERCLEEDAWIGKQAAEPGAALPSTFPSLTALADAGYTTAEDIRGASTSELRRFARLSQSQAEAVLTALAAL